MTTIWTVRFVAAFALVLAVTTAACDGRTYASCREACATTADCGLGLACLATIEGKVCEPEECRACFEAGERCLRDENTAAQESEGAMRECSFRECG